MTHVRAHLHSNLRPSAQTAQPYPPRARRYARLTTSCNPTLCLSVAMLSPKPLLLIQFRPTSPPHSPRIRPHASPPQTHSPTPLNTHLHSTGLPSTSSAMALALYAMEHRNFSVAKARLLYSLLRKPRAVSSAPATNNPNLTKTLPMQRPPPPPNSPLRESIRFPRGQPGKIGKRYLLTFMFAWSTVQRTRAYASSKPLPSYLFSS